MYKCNQCSQQFSKLGNFRVHACLHGNNRCEQCDQSFATPKALQLHTKVHENQADPGQKMFICTACGTEFCSHKSLRLHSRMHAPVRARHVSAPEGTPTATFTCPECGNKTTWSYIKGENTLGRFENRPGFVNFLEKNDKRYILKFGLFLLKDHNFYCLKKFYVVQKISQSGDAMKH